MINVFFSWSFLEPQLTLCSLSLMIRKSLMIRNFSVMVWLRLRARLHILLEHFISLKVLQKHFRTSYLQNEAVNELNANFICPEATRFSLNENTA